MSLKHDLQAGWISIRQRPQLFALVVLFDLLFILVYGFVRTPLASQSAEAFTRLLSGYEGTVDLSVLLSSEYFTPFVASFLLVFLCLYLLFSFLQGTTFYFRFPAS